jgi:Ca-activated chloride channel homolog
MSRRGLEADDRSAALADLAHIPPDEELRRRRFQDCFSRGNVMKSRFSASSFLVLSSLLSPASADALDDTCGLALVLAMDASKSMSSTDFDLAFLGTAAAFRSKEVQAAILAQDLPVAVSAFEWSGQRHQHVVHHWSLLRTREDIEKVAQSLEAHERGGIGQKTGTGAALAFAFALLEEGPTCDRRVIDVSSDGYNSDGMTPNDFYSRQPSPEVTVNALVIGGEARPHLWSYFNEEVVRGPGAFSMSTIDFQDFPVAMKEKLLREVSPRLTGTFGAKFSGRGSAVN